MATGFFLSEEKLKQLNDLLDERNPRWARKGTKSTDQRQQFVSPEVFLCQAPDNDTDTHGIDGMIPAGTDDYDHPGVANCVVCQIVPSVATGQDYDLVPIEDSVRYVFNYSTDPIAKASFFLAVKDKMGNWVAVTPSETFQFHNLSSSSAAAPAYAVMAVFGVEGTSPDVVPKIEKTSATYRKDYLVNQSAEVANDERGKYQNYPEVLALYHTSGTPVLGELWGPTEGQWYLSKGSTGNGDANTTKTRADWGIIVAGIIDATNKIIVGKQVPYGMAKRCKCQIDYATGIVATDATKTVDNVTPIDMGWAPVAAATDEITAHIQLNPSSDGGYVGADNTVCYIQFHEDDGYWWIYDMPCQHT